MSESIVHVLTMVKRQKEKQYQSAKEYKETSRFRGGNGGVGGGKIRRLPFDCCALTLTPFSNPVCAKNGIIFEMSAIMPYILKYKKDPVSGQPMSTKDLITLNFDKDEESGKWQCPVLCKPFSDNTKIVGIRQNPPGTEANVYSMEAVQELNFKTKNYIDLTSGKKFHKTKDLILLQDPNDEEHNRLRDINNFQHLSTLSREKNQLVDGHVGDSNVNHSVTARRIMEKLKRKRDHDAVTRDSKQSTNEKKTEKARVVYTDELSTSVTTTSGMCSGSFTSTSRTITSTNSAREATEEEILLSLFFTMKKMKKKGLVQLCTNFGNIQLEIHCDIVPRTSMNFLGLVEQGKYNGTKFHRSIRNFMIQGGKQKNSKDVSLWGHPFDDEYDDRLIHKGSGILSMSNSGLGTNRCQFFITYKSAPHLNRKHSVFGSVVSGIDVLKRMESVPTDEEDCPKKQIIIDKIEILSNPIPEAQEIEEQNIQIKRNEREKEEQQYQKKPEKRKKPQKQKAEPSVVGKYLSKTLLSEKTVAEKSLIKDCDNDASIEQLIKFPKSKSPPKSKFGNFSGW